MCLQIPTVLAMMATSTDELLQLHSRYPVLAFFLSLCNPSTTAFRLSLNSRQGYDMSPSGRNPEPLERAVLTSRLAAPEQPIERLLFARDMIGGRFRTLPEWQVGLLHLLAALAATISIWLSLVLGIRSISIFGCRSWWNPLLWILCGSAMHICNVLWSRLCLASRPKAGRTQRNLRWTWSLWISREQLYLKRPNLARVKDLLVSAAALINYMFATMVLSGQQLVTANYALLVAAIFAVIAVVARFITIWLLEVVPLEDSSLKRFPSEIFSLEDEEKSYSLKAPRVGIRQRRTF